MNHEKSLPIAYDYLLKISLIALAYFISGRLGLLLAVPPGYATLMWPPSGIALAALLVFGTRYWPGVFLGSLSILLDVSWDLSSFDTMLSTGAVAFTIACGAALQAVIGRRLIFAISNPPFLLDRLSQILTITLVGGLLASLVSSTIANTMLFFSRSITLSELALNWCTWWIGDAIGVMVFTPITLILLFPRDVVSVKRKIWVGVPLMLLFMVTIGIYAVAMNVESARVKSFLNNELNELNENIAQNFRHQELMLKTLQSVVGKSSQLNEGMFNDVARAFISRNTGTQALLWLPMVNRDNIQHMLSNSGDYPASFQNQLMQIAAQLRETPTEVFYPALFAASSWSNRLNKAEFDATQIPVLMDAIMLSANENRFVATPVMAMTFTRQTFASIGVVEPVYGDQATQRGLLVGILDAQHLFGFPVKRSKLDLLSVYILDNQTKQLFRNTPFVQIDADTIKKSVPAHNYREKRELNFRGFQYTIFAETENAFLQAHATGYVWLALMSGLIITSLIGNLLMLTTGMTQSTEHKVSERTNTLQLMNKQLASIAQSGHKKANAHATYFILLCKKIRDELDAKNLGKTTQTLEDAIDLALVEIGDKVLAIKHFDLIEVLTHAVQRNRLVAKQRGVKLEKHVGDTPFFVTSDQEQLEKLLTLLIQQMLEMVSDTTIYIRLTKQSDDLAEGFYRISISAKDSANLARFNNVMFSLDTNDVTVATKLLHAISNGRGVISVDELSVVVIELPLQTAGQER